MTERPRRRAQVVAAVVLSLAFVFASCGTLRSAAKTRGELHRAGFRAATVSANETNGVTTVVVHLRSSTSPVTDDQAAEIVWRTFEYRVDQIRIATTNGSRGYPRFLLEQRFGPRPAALDRRTIGSDFARTGRTVAVIAAIVGVVVLVLVAVAIALIVHFVRRRRGPPPSSPSPSPWPPPSGQPFNPPVSGPGGTGWIPPPGGRG